MRAFICSIILVALFVAVGAKEHHEGRKLAYAPAPGPMMEMREHHHHHKYPGAAEAPGPEMEHEQEHKHDPNDADLLFILSANQAEFTAPNTLQLTGVSTSAQYHDSYEQGQKAGIIMTSIFTNGTAGARYVAADGTWLSNPDAALIGDANASDAATAVLLSLSSPVYDAATQSVAFTVTVLPAEESALKTHRGVTNSLVWEHANGAGTPLVTAVSPGATLTNVALFIDTNKEALRPMAEEKGWWRPWGGGWGWGGGGGWGWGGGWDHRDGWGRGWGGWGWGR